MISSPTCPFPLVAPLTNSPFLYSNATDKPSIFVSTTYLTSSSSSFALLVNSLTISSSLLTLIVVVSWVIVLDVLLSFDLDVAVSFFVVLDFSSILVEKINEDELYEVIDIINGIIEI